MGEDKVILISDPCQDEIESETDNENESEVGCDKQIKKAKVKENDKRGKNRAISNSNKSSTVNKGNILRNKANNIFELNSPPLSQNQQQQTPVSSGRKLSDFEVRFKKLFYNQIPYLCKNTVETLRFHQKFLISGFLTLISSAGCLILFPLYLDIVTEDLPELSFEDKPRRYKSDGYAACFAMSTISTLLFLFVSATLKLFFPREKFFTPILSFWSIFKIGFSVGISLLTIFYAWEDHKVTCNLQDPLLGLVIIFSILTHLVEKWKRLGFRRTFSLLTIASGVFISVDYALIDQNRCRGTYHPPSHPSSDPWTWKVHVVWTLAFVVGIWLWTIAMFCIATTIPLPKIKQKPIYYDEYNAVRMKVIRVQTNVNEGAEATLTTEEGIPNNGEVEAQNNNNDNERRRSIQLGPSPYITVSYHYILNSILWFHIAVWLFILSLFWTEFIPGFGKGPKVENLPTVIVNGFFASFSETSFWWLILSLFVFTQSFPYLMLLVRSPMIALSVSSLGFPILGVFWSVKQILYDHFSLLSVISGELICSIIAFPLILVGIYYLFKLDVLNDEGRRRGQQNQNQTNV